MRCSTGNSSPAMKHNIREHGRTMPVLPFRLPEKRISGKTGRMKLCGESAFCRKNPCGTNCLLPGLHFSPIYAIIMLAAAAGNCTGCTAVKGSGACLPQAP